MTLNCHVDDSTKSRYNINLGIHLLTALRVNLNFSEYVINVNDGPLKGSSAPIVDQGAYEFKDLNIGKITPEWLFTNAYTNEIYKSEQVCTSTKILRTTLNAKNKKSDSSKAMKNI